MPVDAVAAGRLPQGATFGDYRIERLLGRGGMGSVYAATHLTDGRIVALKLLSVDLEQMDARQRFLREGQTAAAINHPNAVYIYGTEEIDGTPAIVMELVSGGTLEELVRKNGPLPVDDAIEKILQVVDGLDAALAVGVLHRDVKPSNCFITADGVAKIGDFGLSKPVDSIEQHKLTQTGLFLGTPVYSSPEQLLGESLDERSDIYAVGVTFYYLLTGRLPYESGSLMQVMAAVLNGTPAPMSDAKAKVSVPLHVQQVVLKAMARHAKDRYQTYGEFREAVAALRVPEVRPATLWERLRAWLVDTLPLSYLLSSVVLFIYNIRGIVIDPSEMQRYIAFPITTYLAMLLVIGVPEGLRGAALGKWLVGIRVVDKAGRAIGIGRSLLRVTMLSWSSFAMVAAYELAASETAAAVSVAILYVLTVVVPFTTARKSNGWRMLHDFATGSYVVRQVPRPRQRRSDIDTSPAPALGRDEQELGQYVLFGEVPAHAGVHAGWDRAMQRRVWIASPSSESELSDARRGVSRLTRLRWTGGVRQDGTRWDVFEAPTGEPLHDRLKRDVSWEVMRNWLTDMLSEARAAQADGSWPAGASTDQLWVTAWDEIVLTDALPQQSTTGEPATPVALLRELSAALLRLPPGNPLSLSATRLLQKLTTVPSLDEADQALSASLGVPVEVTRRRRIGPMVVIAAVAIVFGFFSRSVFTQMGAADPQGSLADQIIDVLRDRRTCTFDHTGEARVQRCLPRQVADSTLGARQKLDVAFDRIRATIGLSSPAAIVQLVKDSAQAVEEKRLAEIYLATRLADRVNDPVRRLPAFSEKDRELARAILARHRVVDSTEAARASYMVDSVWRQKSPHDIREFRAFINGITIVMILTAFAIGALVAAIVMRRGLLLRGFQLDFVMADGRPVPRWRLILRTVIVWAIVVVPVLAVALVNTTPMSRHAMLLVVLVVPSVALWIYGIVTVVRNPRRGLPERLTGTYVVME